MRAKRSKKYRKIMSAYNMHFSFRTPYQVLCDSNFLRQCHAFHMPVQKSLENTLHGDARPYITQCSLASANEHSKGRGRGDGKPMWLPLPTEVPLRYCKHKDDEGKELGVIPEAECLVDLVSGQPRGNESRKNKNHYVLATADAEDEHEARQKQQKKSSLAVVAPVVTRKRKRGVDVREGARSVAGVPIIYVKRSVMVLEEMSGVSERVIRGVEKEKFKEGLIGDSRNLKRKRGDGDDDSDDDGDGGNDGSRKSGKQTSRGAPKVKGPNPMSVRKKKARPSSASQDGAKPETEVNGKEGEDEGDTESKKRRKRRHAKKSSGQEDGVLDTQHETTSAHVRPPSNEVEA